MFRLLSGELLHCYLFVLRRPEWENSRQPLPQATQPELDELVRTGVVYACACVHVCMEAGQTSILEPAFTGFRLDWHPCEVQSASELAV